CIGCALEAGLLAPDLNLKLAGFDAAFSLIVDHRQLARRDRERNLPAFPGLEMNSAEAGERPDRHRYGSIQMPDIELYHFISRQISGVPHFNTHLETVLRFDLLPTQFQIAVLEHCIAQPVTKWVERLAFEITIGSPGHIVVFKGRELLNRLVERNRQPAAGVVVSEQYIGNSVSPLLSRVPGLDDRLDVLVRPVDGQRASTQEHDGHWLPGGLYGFKQLLLRLRKVKGQPVSALESRYVHRHLFAFQIRRNPENHDGGVGGSDVLYSFIEGFRVG